MGAQAFGRPARSPDGTAVTRPSRSSMSTALLDRAVGGFSRRLDRRSLLRRSTFAATALVAAPADFVLRPRTAYAAVCRCQGQACACGSLCCDGYTEFCCTLTGSNGCPPGTVAAGWWKVDGSGFCGGAPRYYLDCNAQCGGCGCRGGICSGACSGTRCGCAWGDCNNRKSGCVQFRYGQCNQQIACLGPIVCRVVTCTPPWVFDGSCTTASRTDNNTANHTRPCLEAPFGGFDGVNDVGGAIRVVGWAIDQNRRDGVEARIFVDQRPMVTTMADLDRPDVGAAYPYYGPNHGFDITIDCEPGRHVVGSLTVGGLAVRRGLPSLGGLTNRGGRRLGCGRLQTCRGRLQVCEAGPQICKTGLQICKTGLQNGVYSLILAPPSESSR